MDLKLRKKISCIWMCEIEPLFKTKLQEVVAKRQNKVKRLSVECMLREYLIEDVSFDQIMNCIQEFLETNNWNLIHGYYQRLCELNIELVDEICFLVFGRNLLCGKEMIALGSWIHDITWVGDQRELEEEYANSRSAILESVVSDEMVSHRTELIKVLNFLISSTCT